jgi:hypothetical protein
MKGSRAITFRGLARLEPPPPRAGRRAPVQAHEAEIAARARDGRDHVRPAGEWSVWGREAEMEAGRIPHRTVAARDVGLHRKWGLHVGEGCDDDAPDPLRGVERQDAPVPFGEGPHHRGLPLGPEGRPGLARPLGRD